MSAVGGVGSKTRTLGPKSGSAGASGRPWPRAAAVPADAPSGIADARAAVAMNERRLSPPSAGAFWGDWSGSSLPAALNGDMSDDHLLQPEAGSPTECGQ